MALFNAICQPSRVWQADSLPHTRLILVARTARREITDEGLPSRSWESKRGGRRGGRRDERDFGVAGGARTCINDTKWTACRRVINLANRLLVQKVTFLVVPDFDFFSDRTQKPIPHWNSRINPESTMMMTLGECVVSAHLPHPVPLVWARP